VEGENEGDSQGKGTVLPLTEIVTSGEWGRGWRMRNLARCLRLGSKLKHRPADYGLFILDIRRSHSDWSVSIADSFVKRES